MNFIASYLILYNFSLCFGWAYILYKQITSLIYSNLNFVETYNEIEQPLKIFQTVAILEILNSAFGFVKSKVVITTIQVSSRLFILWGICNVFPQIISESFGVQMLIFAWSVAEIVRYGYYTCQLLNSLPYFLLWLRYTLFYVLYPLGVTGEILAIMESLRVAYGRSTFVGLPNSLNIEFRYDVVLIMILISYVPCFPIMYGHMISQRKRLLDKPHQS